MPNYRDTTGYALEPIQQSMLTYSSDRYTAPRSMLGVVLHVKVSDDPDNNTSISSADGRGFRHECLVQVVDDGYGNLLTLDNVIITTPFPTGVYNYHEYLPRGSSQYLDGTLDNILKNGDVYQLDGDWCIVEFLADDLKRPYIARWIPHPQNNYDLQTMGAGNPDSSGSGTTLDQRGRIFDRKNGVEIVITSRGDVYLDTTRAMMEYDSSKSSTDGRPPYQIPSKDGGNIKAVLKEDSSLEITWNTQKDGVGVNNAKDPEIPQINPKPKSSSQEQAKTNFTRFKSTKNSVEIFVPNKIKVKTKDFTIDSTYGTIYLDSFEIIADEGVVINSGDVIIAQENELARPLINSDAAEAIKTAHAAASPGWASTGTPAQNAAAIQAISGFLVALVNALEYNQTRIFKAE